jgi:lipopolysaccharide/colanic/teichoic acid biosynthesis glycosyltransferase
MKRLFDFLFSLIGLIFLLPFFIVIALIIILTSKGSVFYLQKRVGINGEDFNLFKFRTMKPNSDKHGLLTIGGRDPRITSVGYFLRKYKLDELPQLFNVLFGDMSIVGPRPEVRKYVDLYSEEQLKVLSVRPGITDQASISYFNENELLGKSNDPEKRYIEEIMPKKLELNLEYIKDNNMFKDICLILKTVGRIFKH